MIFNKTINSYYFEYKKKIIIKPSPIYYFGKKDVRKITIYFVGCHELSVGFYCC